MAGIYVHVPFCDGICIYCGFYSVIGKSLRDKYVPALKREILERRNFFAQEKDSSESSRQLIKTLYFGGGTPSVLSISALEEIVSALRDNFNFTEAAFSGKCCSTDAFEFTVEVNPDDVTPEYAAGLKNLGVNRISMGVQSFDDGQLKWMHRRHSAAEAVAAFEILRDAGFCNISMDLIFGFTGMSSGLWKQNIEKAIALGPEHLSAYQMSIDEGSALDALAKKGRYTPPSDEECAQQYAMLQNLLKDAGYIQYEISNFAKRSDSGSSAETATGCFYSRHNSSYWNRTPYLGLGPGAHSFARNKREWNFPSLSNYCNPQIKEIRGGETLSAKDIFNEQIMLGLRKIEGFQLNSLDKELIKGKLLTIGKMEDDGMLIVKIEENAAAQVNAETEAGRTKAKRVTISIPPDKLFISDYIIKELIY